MFNKVWPEDEFGWSLGESSPLFRSADSDWLRVFGLSVHLILSWFGSAGAQADGLQRAVRPLRQAALTARSQ